MLIVYTNVCTPCKYRSQMRHIDNRARELNTKVKTVETKYNPEFLKQSQEVSDVQLPFVYNTDTRSSLSLNEVKEGFDI